MSYSVLMRQMGIIFLEILLGAAAARLKLITEKDTGFLSRMLTSVFLPCTILSAATGGESSVSLIFICMGLFLGLFVISTLLCRAAGGILNISFQRQAVIVGTACMPNNGFVGMPIVCALLGSGPGAMYATASIAAYNIWFFTYVEGMFRGQGKQALRSLITPCNVSTVVYLVLLASGLRLPAVLQSTCSAVAACTTPLALMVIGAMLAAGDIRGLLIRPVLYLITALRGLIFPLAFMLVLRLLPLDPVTCLALSVIAASPAGTLAAVLARQYDVEPELCSQAVAHSTLFMVLTMPLMILLAAELFPV